MPQHSEGGNHNTDQHQSGGGEGSRTPVLYTYPTASTCLAFLL